MILRNNNYVVHNIKNNNRLNYCKWKARTLSIAMSAITEASRQFLLGKETLLLFYHTYLWLCECYFKDLMRQLYKCRSVFCLVCKKCCGGDYRSVPKYFVPGAIRASRSGDAPLAAELLTPTKATKRNWINMPVNNFHHSLSFEHRFFVGLMPAWRKDRLFKSIEDDKSCGWAHKCTRTFLFYSILPDIGIRHGIRFRAKSNLRLLYLVAYPPKHYSLSSLQEAIC